MTLSAVEAAPKAELHIHLEGSLEPDMLMALAARNKVTIPYRTAAELRAAYDFADLQDFLDLYWAGQSVLRTERDFYELTRAYLERAHRDNVVHAEAYILPQGHTPRGVPFAAVLDGALAAFDDARRDLGMTGGIILGLNRHESQDDALEVSVSRCHGATVSWRWAWKGRRRETRRRSSSVFSIRRVTMAGI